MRNGCWNTERQPGYWVADGWIIDVEHGARVQKIVWVEDEMTKSCGYDFKKTDPKCGGCGK